MSSDINKLHTAHARYHNSVTLRIAGNKQAQAPLSTCQNRIEIKSKNEKNYICQKAERVEGRQAPCYNLKQPMLPLRYLKYKLLG